MSIDTQEQALAEARKRHPEPPYWECACGYRAMPLTDDTDCGCDIYEQEWSLVGTQEQAKAFMAFADAERKEKRG